ncbi:[NiFe] hydrogenase maturation protein HypF [Alkalihalophilus pseudofirmus OF4]|uniref:Carbamoyltransferase n=1 Tax=Alkalihalophilus pseudofirmus (strain ATCC BAA-2126 / JCM 17055 / OF4) TaxID=398511 RepID=D3FUD1_ALKPO|nr:MULTISPECIES: carbamoyltransferase HypF [Alkalihalophilus]ADC48333.1 [NiFe] hydrogenase maturation protein HypF [Alkalihalophilus pseudofirmus OF4]MED1601165.1 carbamoyltransferase HypF [Alkalihalophilus marmarensis]
MDQRGLSKTYKAVKIKVGGRVQGVGFRPYVFSLAKRWQLNGTIQNNSDKVIIHVEGEEYSIEHFLHHLKESPPLLAKITNLEHQPTVYKSYQQFSILESDLTGSPLPAISADSAVCQDCLNELNDPSNRRYHYPFINCTQCGPRYTILEKLPYDRKHTTMHSFMMCEDCLEEYGDPMNRRHHAQPTCCAKCGPSLSLVNQKREVIAEGESAIRGTIDALTEGRIISIKGLGGYHLACDMKQPYAITHLREIKSRPTRPLAVMMRSLEIVKQYCHVSLKEEELLTSPIMPIVVLKQKINRSLPNELAPGLTTLGVMLPYTPLHYLLFKLGGLEGIVLTSANSSGLPIKYHDKDLFEKGGLSEFSLTHNRVIKNPLDDSVVEVNGLDETYLRKARGFVPEPIKTTIDTSGIVALGGQQKNTFSIGIGEHILMSPHIGEVDNEEMLDHFIQQIGVYKRIVNIDMDHVAIDKHLGYSVNKLAKDLSPNVVTVGHHHAHHVACMEDNGVVDPCVGIILDGTGYGEDGHIWGFEFLYGDAAAYKRLAHMCYCPLPGGEMAVKEPWRTASGMILHHWPKEGQEMAERLFPDKKAEISILKKMVKLKINSPMAGTCGRLFDTVSAILGVCLKSSYEGEAAIKLAGYMNENYLNARSIEKVAQSYPFKIIQSAKGPFQLDFSPMISQIIQEKEQLQLEEIIYKFHQTVVLSCVEMILALYKEKAWLPKRIVLSGGSFQNGYLSRELSNSLKQKGFKVYAHQQIPCHDGGLSFGQLIIAAHKVKNEKLK